MQRDRGLSSHLLGERPSGHNRGSGPHPLHPGTHQQARRLLGHPLKLGSPSLIGPHPGLSILQPAHLPKRRLRSAPQPLLASRRTPTTLVDTRLLDKATGAMVHTLRRQILLVTTGLKPDRGEKKILVIRLIYVSDKMIQPCKQRT